jgi:hypothetical protein
LIWDKHLKEKKISKNTAQKLKKFKDDALAAIANDPSPDVVDKWFSDDIVKTKQDKFFNLDEKKAIVHHSTLMRYAMKAYLETTIPNKGGKNARLEASCTLQMVSCFWNNVSTYSGIGAYIGGPGATVGALAGVFVSFNSCSCDAEACSYPKFLSTPDICYNQFYGLEFAVGGVSSATNHLTWSFMDIGGTVFLTKDSFSNTTHLYHSELNGRRYFEVYVTAHCNGGYYTTARVGIDIDMLGKPSFFLSGDTYPKVGTQQFYSISGRNLNTVNWGAGSIGQILSQNSYGINVNWKSTGYAYLYANAQSNCGSINNGLNIVVHN